MANSAAVHGPAVERDEGAPRRRARLV